MKPLILAGIVHCFTKACQDSTLVESTAEKGMAELATLPSQLSW